MTNRRRCHRHVHCRSRRAATQTKLVVLAARAEAEGVQASHLLSGYETTLNTAGAFAKIPWT